MPQWQGKSKGTPLGYKIFVLVIRYLGVKPAYVLLRVVAAYYVAFSWRSSRVIYTYFQKVHHYSRVKAWRSIYRNFYVFGQTLIDKLTVMAGIENCFTYNFDGEQYLHEMVKGGRGGVLLSAHVGNWEAAGHLLKRLNTRIHVVMFDGEHEQIKQYVNTVTGERTFHIIVIKNDMSHVYSIADALQKNELICLHADRFLDGNKTERKIFMGHAALFPVGPFQLAAGFGVPVAVVFAFKQTSTHYHFYGTTLQQRKPGETKNEFTTRLMNFFVAQLEEKIKVYPEQWFNYYNFWENLCLKKTAEKEQAQHLSNKQRMTQV
jgi:predicted LPLAT superfamily acyltransferase